ncbi:MAG: hypothetical protein V1729_06305 [Candidatus Woesearchaeota archaeon]
MSLDELFKWGRNSAVGTGICLAIAQIGGCGAVSTIYEKEVTEVQAPADPTRQDPKDDYICSTADEEIPLMIFNTVRFDPNVPDLEQHMDDQRVYEGGLTLGELFESALDAGLAYTAEGFKARYDATPELKAALYADLSARAMDTTCATSQEESESVIDSMFNSIFDDGTGALDFRLRDTNAIYLSRTTGNDGVERTYMMLVGGLVPTSVDQPGDPVVLYWTPMDNTVSLLESIEGGGI